LIIAPYKYSYLLTDKFFVDNCLWQFYGITFKPRVGNILLQGLECYKDTQIKAYDITKITAKLKSSDSVQYRKKCFTMLLDLLGVGKYRHRLL